TGPDTKLTCRYFSFLATRSPLMSSVATHFIITSLKLSLAPWRKAGVLDNRWLIPKREIRYK
ncbi:hypothetical protein, partial [Pseudomonas viridiflava]|uniref:hypothetical protein n=1 Tax=Pseudomonas viridiflava TaxID=33069 RepID=UPI0019D199E0